MRKVAVLSLHTSPLAQAGAGDGGGMNVYVHELSSALARSGVDCDVFTRLWQPGLPPVVAVEPGYRVHHLPVGPAGAAKEDLGDVVDEFAERVLERVRADGYPDVIHANYWLSGVAGHSLKHELGLPLVSTFHTLARVKAEAPGDEPEMRARREAEVIGCCDAILASGAEERSQLERLYDAVPERIEVVSPGVDPATFFPGGRAASRRVLGVGDGPLLLFAGRIQPLKGLAIAVRTLACLDDSRAVLLVVGGPSGPDGTDELRRARSLVAELGLERRVRFVPPQRHDRLAVFYRAADVCLVPSRSESFGLVALEAAACGTPVVAAAVGGLRSLVDHGGSGFLVEGRDPEAFAGYAGKLLADPDLAQQMGREAVRRSTGYRWSMSAARLRRIYADLTARALVECR